ncbi:hypothetical protein CVT25_003088 [Psilocybe cyanescens]|uniref:Uncharacterized protein n=1 Tax=Psilocybe cyanescens TaxID=93625 RepID=A0A409XQV8_PSICY|nr:hypothetical protein CVT25_003088 [Psilocybe cyanescens]
MPAHMELGSVCSSDSSANCKKDAGRSMRSGLRTSFNSRLLFKLLSFTIYPQPRLIFKLPTPHTERDGTLELTGFEAQIQIQLLTPPINPLP